MRRLEGAASIDASERAPASERPAAARVAGERMRRPGSSAESWLLLAPFLFGVVVLVAGPAMLTAGLSLFEADLVRRPEYLGWGNFTALVDDPIFRAAVRNSLIYIAGAVPLRALAAFGLGAAAARPVPRRVGVPHGHLPPDGDPRRLVRPRLAVDPQPAVRPAQPRPRGDRHRRPGVAVGPVGGPRRAR